MPTYTYHCAACGHAFERFEKMTASAHPPCPECGRRAAREITGGAGIAVRSPAPEGCADPSPSGGCCGGTCGLN